MIYRTHDTLSTLNILRSSTRINIYMLTYCCSKACLYRLVTLDVNFSCLIRVDFLTSFSTCNHEHIVCILQRGGGLHLLQLLTTFYCGCLACSQRWIKPNLIFNQQITQKYYCYCYNLFSPRKLEICLTASLISYFQVCCAAYRGKTVFILIIALGFNTSKSMSNNVNK